MKWDEVKLLAGKIAKTFAAWITVSPILSDFLLPMVSMVSFALVPFFFRLFFLSWSLADPAFFSRPHGLSWLETYLIPNIKNLLVIVEIPLLAIGMSLFCASLLVSVRGLRGGNKLVLNGPYKYIRHPQHLGLVLIFLALALYIPVGIYDIGVRLGDLVSWIQFVLLMVAFSDWEDYHLRKKFQDIYLKYYVKTGFLTPKITRSKGLGYFSIFRHPKARYLLFISLYVLIIIGLYVYSEVGPVGGYY